MIIDFEHQPEKYDNTSLAELMHVHTAEVSRIKTEIDDFESQLRSEKTRLIS